MATIKIEYQSDCLEMERSVNIIYPDGFEVAKKDIDDHDIPVLYLLHGMGGNENSWQKRTNIERLLRYTNLIVVMPSTDLGWYTNTTYGMKYYTSIIEELPQVLHRIFPNMTTKRENTFIAGLSMGGYGAFKLALKSNQFSYAASFSGALSFSKESLVNGNEESLSYWEGIFGPLDDKDVEKHFLTNMVSESDKKTKFYAWCGYEDFLYSANEQAISDLKALGLDIEYKTDHGKHEWYYWNKQLDVLFEWLPIEYIKEERLS
ncbi:hypothetical protein HMPREF9318_00638 [Streptococcus urinalis FB127-CNA-2]|uniref:Esterase n=1 Tax=Streptococcus urinalis 2285-97 TaxID=764291 RepID=G5KH00_9STRE|nr:alpha/beta hydrolase family protein [Streptococcus urinalis]EHJ57432.1 putative esterase [Streptococcus urinalis 2285-97]EKS22440.1 hypothetical protein HMPREF9318_00638 [Streptococcus urinalis FB127-CNA-2]VEF32253.1 acetyl esterase [Streptococcus urinalis]